MNVDKTGVDVRWAYRWLAAIAVMVMFNFIMWWWM